MKLRRHSYSAPGRLCLDRLERATKHLGLRVSSLSRAVSASNLSASSTMRENRCSRCHRYKRDPPSPDLGHEGSHAESKCRLDHHPLPCDHVDESGAPCSYVLNFDSNAPPEGAVDTGILEDKLTAQSLEMNQIKADMLNMRQMMESMRLPASTTASLSMGVSTGMTTATTTTSSQLGPRSSLLQTPVSAAVPSLGQGSLHDEAQNLILRNATVSQAGNGLPGYFGPNMKDIQQDTSIASEVQRQLAAIIAATPALQKVVAGQPATPAVTQYRDARQQKLPLATGGLPPGSHSHVAFQAIQAGARGAVSDQELNLLDMDSMLGLTVREKQYRPHEFASRGNFFYAKNINDRNITLPLYVYGYLKHCIILLSGLVPVAEGEVMARLTHLMNVMEITSNNSTLNDFDHSAWNLGRGYGDRVFNDIQQGLRNWTELPQNILPDVFLHVKDMVDMQNRKKDTTMGRGGRGGGGNGNNGRGRGGAGKERGSEKGGNEKTLVCTTYNDFFTGSGCAYEYNNQRKCNYEHFCSKCFTNTGNKANHKARFCTEAASTVAVPTTSG